MENQDIQNTDYTLKMLVVSFLAAIVLPTQFVEVDKKFDNIPKTLPSIIGLIVSLGIIKNSKHELTECEKEISDRYEGLDIRESQLSEREIRIINAEETAKSERNRKQAELNQKIQNINENEQDLRKRLDSINQLIDDRAEIMAEKLNNEYVQRQRELDDEYQGKHSQIMTWYEQQHKKLNDYKHEIDIRIIEIKTEHNFEVNKYERKIQQLQLTIQNLNNRIKQFNSPKFAIGGDEIAVCEANKVINFLWRHEPPIEVDAEPLATPIETGERETRFWLRLRDPLQFPLLKSEKVLNGIRFEVGKNTSPVIHQEESTDLVRVTLPWNSKAPKPEELNRKSVESSIKNILDVGANRSWLVTGHPGAGKTSVLIYLGQQFGGKDAVKIALNPHEDEQSSYSQYGYIEINELSEIHNNINLLKAELELRRKDKSRRFKLVVCVDELGAILDAGDSSEIMGIFRQLAVEGRKLGLVVLIGNHSQTTKAISMDAEFRSAFYQLFLVGAARYAVEQPNRNTGLSKLEENWIKNASYPALMLANMQYSLVKHPTHSQYREYRDRGNLPRNLEQWESSISITELTKVLGVSSSKFRDKIDKSEFCENSENQIQQLLKSLPVKTLAPVNSGIELWEVIKADLSIQSKTYVIENVLGCGGKYFKQCSRLIDLLREKYES